MKIRNVVIFAFLICLFACKKDRETVVDDNKKYVKLLWRNKPFDWSPTTLEVKNKMLYFGDLHRNFYAVNLENAKIKLKFKTDYNPFYKPLIDGQDLFLADYNAELSCFDSLGKLKWQVNGEMNLRKDLAEKGNYIYGSVQGNGFSKLNKKDGKVVWYLPKDSNITETNEPTFFENRVYLGLSEYDAKLLAIDNKSGKIIWENKYKKYSNLNQIKTEKGLLVCLNKDFKQGEILMLDYETGNEIWSESFNCDVFYEPCVANKSIILSTYDSKVVSVNIENGKTNWVLDLKNDQVESKIISLKGNIYFGTMNRNLYSLNIKTGKINFIQQFYYGISTPIVEDNKIYFPTGGSEMWVLK